MLVDDHLKLIREFGPIATNGDSNEYRVTPDPSNGFWSTRVVYDYEISKWSAQGTLVRTLRPESWWFSDVEVGLSPSPNPETIRPRPRVNGIALEDGRLWIVAVIADAEWRPVALVEKGGERPPPGLTALSELFDSVVEVVDLASGRILSSRRYEGVIIGMLPDRTMWEMLEDVDGSLALRLVRPSLRGR